MNLAYKLKNIEFAYDDGPTILQIPELEVKKGEVIALVGPNGAGKTSLLNLLAFLVTPRSGDICFFGEKAVDKNILAFRRRTGLLSQNPYLFRGSVLSNIEWGLKVRGVMAGERKSRAVAALAQVGLSGDENRLGRQLSGGEAQRVALARVLALDPDVLFLDEPATYMDQESVAFTEKIVRDLNKEKETTVFITTHDIMKGYSLADMVLSLVKGSIVEASLANFFSGKVIKGSHFDTGRMVVHLPAGVDEGTHVSIDPAHIVVSKESLASSSMRNSIKGRIVSIIEENGKVRLEIAAQECFQVLITAESLTLLDLRLGEDVWLSFKSTAVKVF